MERGPLMIRVVATLCALGCAPPEPLGDGVGTSTPEIRLLYPPLDAGIAVDAEGNLQTLVVVDIIGLEFVSPAEQPPLTDGQGHWHINPQGVYLTAPPALSYELDSDAFTVGQRGLIVTDLQDNEHAPLTQTIGTCPTCEDRIEFDVLAEGSASTESFENLVADGDIEWRDHFDEILDR
jgi:hypothetical protein